MQKILISIFLIALVSCTSRHPGTADAPLYIQVDTLAIKPMIIEDSAEEGWGADIKLSIAQTIQSDSATTYKAISSYKGKNIGLEISIPTYVPQAENEIVQLLTIKSSGQISNNLLSTLSNLYKLKSGDTTKQFIDSVRVSFIDLNEFAKAKFGKDADNKTTTKETKIFFEPANADDYAELYLNINETEHWIEIKEKDDSYREQVIKFLTKK